MRTGDPVRQGEIMVVVPADVAVLAALQDLCREPEAAQPVPRGLDIPDPKRWRVDNPHMKLFPQLYPRNWENRCRTCRGTRWPRRGQSIRI